MGEGDSDRRDGGAPQEPTAADVKARLSRLGQRIDTLKGEGQRRTAAANRTTDDSQGMARGFRLSTEFVAAIIVGGGLGWALDRFAGTRPLGMVVLVMLGFVAGVLNVMRAAGLSDEPPAGGEH